MIDFSQFKTAEEKLIALFLSVSEPMRQKEIYSILNISRRHCAIFLEELEKRGFIEKSEEQFGIVLYKWNTGASMIPVGASVSPAPLTVNVNSNFNKLNSTGEKNDWGNASHSCPVCGSSGNHSVPDVPHGQNAITRPQTATDASGVKSTSHERDCARSSHEQDCVSPAFTAPDEDTNGRVAAPANGQIAQNGNTELQSGKPGRCKARSADTAGLTQSRSLTETAGRPETQFPALEYEKTGRYAHRPKFTKIVEMPQNGDFDGLIYAADLNRYTYMSRMIAALGVGESANGLVGELPFQEERFLLFKPVR